MTTGTKPPIPHAELLRLFSYDPLAGVFSRRIAHGPAKAGPCVVRIDRWGYQKIAVGGKQAFVHRLAVYYVTGVWPEGQVDHKNRVRSENHYDNLRPSDAVLNGQNRLDAVPSKKSSGSIGVYGEDGRFRARIRVNGKRKALGTFATEEEASAAYLKAKAVEHPGAWMPASLNAAAVGAARAFAAGVAGADLDA